MFVCSLSVAYVVRGCAVIAVNAGRAFALEGRGVWHAMTASVCQQLLGPVRLRSSLRLALEHPHPLTKVSQEPNSASALVAASPWDPVHVWRQHVDQAQQPRQAAWDGVDV